MRFRFLAYLAIAALVVGAVGLGLSALSNLMPTGARVVPIAQPRQADPDNRPAFAKAPSREDTRGDDRLRAYRARVDFHERASRFIAGAATATSELRQREARSLEDDIARYESAGDLSAGETLLLRIGLIQATEPDPERQKARMIDLAARYKLDAERRNAAFVEAKQRDPAFQAYKQREQRVVAEVMAMSSIPGGLSRDEYLRRRLQHERELAYSRAP